jgi:hypothetical protein
MQKSIESLPRSTSIGLRTIRAAFQLLATTQGPVPYSEIRRYILNTVPMSTWDETSTKAGRPRWENQLGFHSIWCIKAGMLQRNRESGWIVTPFGKDLYLHASEQEFFDSYWLVHQS